MAKRIFLIFTISLLFTTVQNCLAQKKISLKNAIDLARTHHPMVKVLQMTAEAEKYDIKTAGLRPNILLNDQSLLLADPFFNSQLPDLPTSRALPSFIYGSHNVQSWLQATKQFQILGKRKAKIAYQTQDYKYAVENANFEISQLLLMTAYQWLEAWYANEAYENLKLAKANSDSLLVTNQQRFKTAEISKNDLERSEILSERHTNMLYSAAQKLRTELLKLSYMIGEKENLAIDNETDNFFQNLIMDEANLLENALKVHPNIVIAENKKELEKSALALSRKMAIPNIEAGPIFNPQNTQPYIGWYIQVLIPVFDRNQGEISKSIMNMDRTTEAIEATKNKISFVVRHSMQDYITYRENVVRFASIKAKSNDILSNIRNSYLSGKTGLVDYLYAKEYWFDTEKEFDETYYNYLKSYIELLYDTGNLK
ncbi:MAG: TolC family protein [Cytophagales bacterium]